MTVRPYWFLVALVLAVGCAADEPTPENESSELITTLTLHFTPDGGGETLSFSASDPDGTGDLDVEEIPLPDGSDHSHHDSQLYALEVELLDELEGLDMGARLEENAEEYQIFFTGSAVEGPATGPNNDAIVAHSYVDDDNDGLPLGLENTITTQAWGSGELTVTVHHLSEAKGDNLAGEVASDGIEAVDGTTEFRVTFDIEVE